MNIRHFDPQGVNLAKAPISKYESIGDSQDAILTINISRVSAGTPKDLSFQLFGALNGIHASENNASFPNVATGFDWSRTKEALLTNLTKTRKIATELVAAVDFAAFKAAVTTDLATNLIFEPYTVLAELMGTDTRIVEWQQDGSLKISTVNPTDGTVDEYIVISCEEVPYKTLIENLKTSVLLVKNMRFGYVQETSLDKSLSFVYASMFGSDQTNNLVPRRYFTPEQQQSRIVDIDQSYFLTGELAINSVMKANETNLSFILDVTKFQKNAVANSF